MTMSRFHAYQQLEYSDCGITCIRMIARFYGKRVPLAWLREQCNVSRLGISLGDILQCMRHMGFHAEAARVNAEEVLRMPLPAILHWNQNHFVVLYGVEKHGQCYCIADPAQGKVRLSRADFLEHWMGDNDCGLCAVMDPTDDFDRMEFPPEPRILLRLTRMVGRFIGLYRRSFLTALALSAATIGADMALPMLLQHTIDEGIGQRDVALVWLLVLGQLAIFVGQFAANGVSDLLLTRIGLRTGIRLVQEYLEKLIALPIAFFDRKVSSDLIQKIEDQNRLRGFLVSLPDLLFFTVISLLVFSGMLIYYNGSIFLLFIALTLLAFGWNQLFLQRRKEIDYASSTCEGESRNMLYELVNGMDEVKVNNAEQLRVDAWRKLQQKLNRLVWKGALNSLRLRSGSAFIDRLKEIGITGICATLVIRGQLTFGEMMTISYIVGRLSQPFSNLVSAVNQVQDAAMSYERLDEVMNAEKPDSTALHTHCDLPMDLRLEGVWFKYPGNFAPYCLSDVTLHIPEGRTTAIVGESGCGKSTLLKLLLGFYPPERGSIKVGGVPLSDFSEEAWLAQCGAVLQSGQIFSDTILHNIALSDAHPSDEKAQNAAKAACIDEFIAQLPMGYHTMLGSTGLQLSGGQRQRLLIARAVYKQPRLLLLDEATSSLDALNESRIVEHLTRFSEGRTVVIAAHRLSTILHADHIVFMHEGRVVEQGTHEQLLHAKGAYWKLFKEQVGGV